MSWTPSRPISSTDAGGPASGSDAQGNETGPGPGHPETGHGRAPDPAGSRPAVELGAGPRGEPDPRGGYQLDPRLGQRNNLEAMDPLLKTIQPGGGLVMSLELAWGSLRRQLLRRFRAGYVERMRNLRQGTAGSLPFDPIDSRDLKYYRNQETYWWPDSDDPFRWRDSLPFARVGLGELLVIGGFFLLSGLVLSWIWWPLGLPLLVICALVIWFFRDPPREIPAEHGVVVSPADGLVVQIDEIDDPEIGPAVQFGIFLSIFDVHINRSSLEGSVVAVRYRPGKFLNALRPQSAQENENLDVLLQCRERPFQLFRIRQITGQFARRIVCWARPGDLLSKGEQYGMIKLGSRTELVIPRDQSLEIETAIGQKVAAGSTRLARYRFDISAQQPPDPMTTPTPPLGDSHGIRSEEQP